MKDETGISNSKMCSISVACFFSECAGLTRVTLFRAQIERFWLGFPKNAISYFYLFILTKLRLFLFSDQNLSSRAKVSNRK